MAKRQPDLKVCLGLGILFLVILAFVLLTKYRPGFFRDIAPVF
jgi:hypothetical protein